jgi:hypothetical protein
MKTNLVAVIAVTLGLSAFARADSIETQTFGPTGTTTNLGLAAFNTALGTLDSVSLVFTAMGNIPQTDLGGVTIDISIFSFPFGTTCLGQASCHVTFTGTASDDNPAALPDFEAPFTNSFSTSGTITDASVSGTLTYDYTPAVVSAVPEPASWGLLLTLVGMCLIVRKRSAWIR